MRNIVLGLLLLLGLLAGSAAIADLRMHIGTAGTSLTLGNPTLSGSVFTPNTPNGVVGTLSATTSDGSAVQWQIVGTNSGGFHVINGNTLVQAVAGTPCATYTDSQARASSSAAVNSPQTLALTLTPSSSCDVAITLGPTSLSTSTFQAVAGNHGAAIATISTASTGASNPGYSLITTCGANCADSAKFSIPVGTNVLNVGASDVVCDPSCPATYHITIRDTQAGAANSPFDQALTLTGQGVTVTASAFNTGRNAGSHFTFSDNNLTAAGNAADVSAFTTLFHSSGAWFFEVVTSSNCNADCGVGLASAAEVNGNYLGQSTQSVGFYGDGTVWFNGAVTGQSTGVTWASGAVVAVRVDLTARTVQLAVNGGSLGSSISLPALATFNLSPAWNSGRSGVSGTFVGGPPSAYSTTQWDGGAAPQTPLAVSFNPSSSVSVGDTTASGTTISGINVRTNNGAPFAGAVAIPPNGQSSPGLVNLSSSTLPSNVRAARNFTSGDDGSHTVTVQASENGVTASATLTMDVSSIVANACDIGPSTTIPAAIQNMGFNHCFLNADFSQNVTVNGTNFTDPNTFIYECSGRPVGGSGITGNTTYMHLVRIHEDVDNPNQDLNHGGNVYEGAPCNYNNVITDPEMGNSAYDFVMRVSDCQPANTSPHPICSGPYDQMRILWPTTDAGALNVPPGSPGYPFGGPIGGGMSNWAFFEFTYRIPSSSLDSGSIHGDSGLLDAYPNGVGPDLGQYEIDFFESHYSQYDGTTLPQGGCGTYPVAPDTARFAFDTRIKEYHKWGCLFTWNGVDTISECRFYDDAQIFSPCYHDPRSYTASGNGGLISLWNQSEECYGDGFGCNSADLHIYIKSMRVFSCSNFWSSTGCTNIFHASKDKPKSRFASAIESAWNYLASVVTTSGQYLAELILPAANAQNQLDGHIGGFWVCEDGTLGPRALCRPPEFRGNVDGDTEWWKSCLPDHPDCVWSQTAINGHHRATLGDISHGTSSHYYTRGPGWCYKSQPYTCSNDGKVPQ